LAGPRWRLVESITCSWLWQDLSAPDFRRGATFQLPERVHLQLRAEAFNVLNHTNFQMDGAEMASLNDPLFGQAGGTFNPRQLQFGLKASF